jgi:TetR/AcrR family transcriptional regulator, regulator of autoinduction and epiphytic fitness
VAGTGRKSGQGAALGAVDDTIVRPSSVLSDRRVARGQLSRTMLVEAMIDLIQEGNFHPTAGEIADRAGVSVRTLFNHFHIDALLGVAAAELVARHRMLVAHVPPHGPVEVRIRATCHQRRQLFETTAPMLRVVHTRVEISPGLVGVVVELRSFLQQQVAATFSREIALGGHGDIGLLEDLDLVTGWQSWSRLRYHPERSATAAERAMAGCVTRLLG